MQTIADHPVIDAIQKTGYPWGYSEARKLHTCKKCGHGICEGEEYYDINGKILCKECVRRIKKVAVYCDWCGKEFDPIEDGFFQFDKELVCPECVEEDCKCCDE